MRRRHFSAVLPVFTMPLLARAGSFGGVSELDASQGLRTALEKGAVSAVQVLGRPDGFLGDPQVHIPLPKALHDAAHLLTALGMRKQLEDLELAMNRAAEAAVPHAKTLLSDAVRHIGIEDARKILAGGETSVTEFFADKTRQPLTVTFLPAVHQATSQVGVVEKYDRLAQKAQAMGLYRPEDPSVDHYVTRKALDGLYFMIGEEEKKIRRDPVATGSALLAKVFGGMR
jgi:hypothetical protein